MCTCTVFLLKWIIFGRGLVWRMTNRLAPVVSAFFFFFFFFFFFLSFFITSCSCICLFNPISLLLWDITYKIIVSCTRLYTFEKKRENDRKDRVCRQTRWQIRSHNSCLSCIKNGVFPLRHVKLAVIKLVQQNRNVLANSSSLLHYYFFSFLAIKSMRPWDASERNFSELWRNSLQTSQNIFHSRRTNWEHVFSLMCIWCFIRPGIY